MGNFENFKPQLKSGRITPQGEKIIFETEKPIDQIVLPIELADFLVLCNGENRIGDIIEILYHRKTGIQFKAIFKTLLYLKKRNFLENGDELEVESSIEDSAERSFLTFKPIFELNIGNRIFSEHERPMLFYTTAMITIVLAILSLQSLNTKWLNLDFLRFNQSYVSGLAFIFLFSSILLTIKNLFKCMLLLFLTGRAYNFSLAFNGFALYFKVKSDSLFLISQKLYIFVYYAATTLFYFPAIAIFYTLMPELPYQEYLMSLGFFLLLFELNPFQESESTFFIKSMFNDDSLNKLSQYQKEKSLIALLHPNERNRDHGSFLLFTQFAIGWSVLLTAVLLVSLKNHAAPLLQTLKSASIPEQMAALITASYLLTLLFIIGHNSFRIAYLSLYLPLTHALQSRKRRRKSQSVTFYDKKELIQVLNTLPLFNYFSNELLELIVAKSALKEHVATSPVIVEGDPGTHLFVLLAGKLKVRKKFVSGRIKNISEVLPPSIFGETAVLEEESKRAADVIAQERSIVLQVPAKLLRKIAEESQYIRELDVFRNAIVVNQFFSSAPIFRDLSEQILQLFITKGKIETFLPDQIVFKQNDVGDGFYLLLRGSVGVSVNGRVISRIQQGGFFGEVSMIADIPRTATVFSQEHTQTLKISRDAFWEILAHDIGMAMFIESVGEMRISEDIDIIRSDKARVA